MPTPSSSIRLRTRHTSTIAALFLGKAVIVGLVGGLLGCLLGWVVCELVFSQSGGSAFARVGILPVHLAIALIGAPLVACLASYLPTLTAVARDPSAILNER